MIDHINNEEIKKEKRNSTYSLHTAMRMTKSVAGEKRYRLSVIHVEIQSRIVAHVDMCECVNVWIYTYSGKPAGLETRNSSSMRNGSTFFRSWLPMERRTRAPTPSACSRAWTTLETSRGCMLLTVVSGREEEIWTG